MDMETLTFDTIATKALETMETTNKHIFLTGKAGTGKSTLLMYFLETTKKNIVLLAPTGVAALNI
jgi:ABC-type lipoprotein export system ATPase subunit